eukprot:4794890-Prymnesium_polylepis.1
MPPRAVPWFECGWRECCRVRLLVPTREECRCSLLVRLRVAHAGLNMRSASRAEVWLAPGAAPVPKSRPALIAEM